MSDRKQEILNAAVAIADELGLEAVSMRSVADRVGVTPMALYPHVGSKGALLDAMVEYLGGELIPAMAAGDSWRERLYGMAQAAREMSRRHPWAGILIFARPSVAGDAVRVTDLVYEGLLEAGVPEAEVPRLERLISTFVLGYALSETGGRFGGAEEDPRGTRGQQPGGPLPGHTRLAPWLSKTPDWDAEFAADLRDLEQLIESKAGRRTGPQAPPTTSAPT
jgi:AcrR family transcriptional regulator